MFPTLRAATAEEVEEIKKEANLGPNCIVLAWDPSPGKTVKVVVRTCMEADPLFFGEGVSRSQKVMFYTLLEHALKFGFGAMEYYFNVGAEDKEWQQILESLGAESISKEPEFRFKKVIK